jgi:hypothetical protein
MRIMHTCNVHITICIRIVVGLLHYFPNILRDSGMLSVFIAYAHAPLQQLRRLLDVFLHIAYNTSLKKKIRHEIDQNKNRPDKKI